MQVNVHVEPRVAAALLRQAPESGESKALVEALDSLQVELQPLHPNIDDPSLASQFTVEAGDRGAAEAVAKRLRSLPGVTAAYLKPRGGPP